MSTHFVNIIEIAEVKDHPNADRLELIPIGGWQCVSGKGNFKVGDKAIYIQPDYVVPTDNEHFSFLAKEGKDTHRLRAVRLRGELSYGLLIPVPEELDDLPVGTNVMEHFGIVRYEEPIRFTTGGQSDSLPHKDWPQIYCPKFDVESLANFPDVISPDTEVVLTEKIHGANAKYVYHDGKFYVGRRNSWLKEDLTTPWHSVKSLEKIKEFCSAYPDHILFGEVFGKVQSLRYNLETGVEFVAFAVMHNGQFLDMVGDSFFSVLNEYGVETVPVLNVCKMSEINFDIAERNSVLAHKYGLKEQIMEGFVITPVEGFVDPNIGFVQLKHISNNYWLKG